MSVILTGGTGFLGSHLIKKLLENDFEVILLKRSFSNTKRIDDIKNNLIIYNIDEISLENIFLNHQVDGIIHTATSYGRNGQLNSEVVETNILFPLTLLELGIKYQIDYFINTDSFFNNGENEYKYLSGYSLSKKQFIDWAKQVTLLKKVKFINMKLEHMYGPMDANSKFVTYIIKSCQENVKELNLTGGDQKRDFIYVSDVVNAFITVLKNVDNMKCNYLQLGVGAGFSTSIRDFVEKVHNITKSKTKLNFGTLPYRENEIMFSKADNDRLKKLGWIPEVDLEKGIKSILISDTNVNARK